ncbi:adenylyl-sulfate kinase [Guptibacillus algicola]|uniref:adenylyl-sulfate kinase n=1 Tax=Guptibacillus algicola TaxID=225844 RepID=UPI001CD59318|nr:adenylyl-sulfate kinase [Alkalihalobacillus algicola]MCA0988717.1 adenylyl-sulfate kinase [Alkalihalobacillus algicola]
MDKHIHWQSHSIQKKDRQLLHEHKSYIVWFTGLSGSGKSTIANELEKALHSRGLSTFLLDGDNLRHGLNADLGFQEDDRKENIRRVGEVAKLFVESGTVVLTAFISPYNSDREMVRNLVGADEFIEVYIDCPLEECEKRDPKGLYEKVRTGEIKEFTGISAPYEAPQSPDVTLYTAIYSVPDCVHQLVNYLRSKGLLAQ